MYDRRAERPRWFYNFLWVMIGFAIGGILFGCGGGGSNDTGFQSSVIKAPMSIPEDFPDQNFNCNESCPYDWACGIIDYIWWEKKNGTLFSADNGKKYILQCFEDEDWWWRNL